MAVQATASRKSVEAFFQDPNLPSHNQALIEKVNAIRNESAIICRPTLYQAPELDRPALYDPASKRTVIVWNGENDPQLGQGMDRTFFLGTDEKVNRLAVGILRVNTENKVGVESELKCLDKLKNAENIVQTHFVVKSDSEISEGSQIYYAQSYCDSGDLYDFIVNRHFTKLGLADRLLLIQDIAQGVANIHAYDVIHRDLKEENVLLNRENGRTRAKIGDFGFAFLTKDNKAAKIPCGSFLYTSPQRYKMMNEKPSRLPTVTNKTSDLWSLGCIFFRAMTFGRFPWCQFEGKTINRDKTIKTLENYKEGDYEEKIRVALEKTDYPPELQKLTLDLLSFQPGRRPTALKIAREIAKLCPPVDDEKSTS